MTPKPTEERSPLDNAIQKKLAEFDEKFRKFNVHDSATGPNYRVAFTQEDVKSFLSQSLRDIIREYREGTRVEPVRFSDENKPPKYLEYPEPGWLRFEEGHQIAVSESQRKGQEWCGEDK